jgi:hypothetical protein
MLQCWRKSTQPQGWTGCGKAGRQVMFVCVPEGLKSLGGQSWNHMTATLCQGGCVCYQHNDPDIRMRPMTKLNGGKGLRVCPTLCG